VEAHVLRAVANAWSWRRKLKAGQASTNLDLARTEDISDRHIGRMIKLAYLAPAVVKKLLLQRSLLAVSVKDLTAIADLPWAEQVSAAFGSRGVSIGVQSPPPIGAPRANASQDGTQARVGCSSTTSRWWIVPVTGASMKASECNRREGWCSSRCLLQGLSTLW